MVVLFPVRPQLPYVERLQFLTDIIPHTDGTEQLVRLRKNPRQSFDWDVFLVNGSTERGKIDSLLFDQQDEIWGVPIWAEETHLTVAASASATTITVESTADADYRNGGEVVIHQDSLTHEFHTIVSFTATTITIDTGLTNSYAVGVSVAPMRQAHMLSRVQSVRQRSADQILKLNFRVIDNDSDLGDNSDFGMHNSKVLLDAGNVVVGNSVSEVSLRNMTVLDNGAGSVFQSSPWTRSKKGSLLTLHTRSKADLWSHRKLMHFLSGQGISFYVPTFGKDLIPDVDLVSGSNELKIKNIGYTTYVQSRQPKNQIWIRLKSGSKLTRTINSSVVNSSTQETLTLNSNWPISVSVSDIDRISYLEEVRYNSDDITLNHERGGQLVRISAPIISTFD